MYSSRGKFFREVVTNYLGGLKKVWYGGNSGGATCLEWGVRHRYSLGRGLKKLFI
jgi:hypothetical protein